MVNAKDRTQELGLKCQNCGSLYLNFQAQLEFTTIYKCTSCKRNSSFSKEYLAKLRREKTQEEKVAKLGTVTLEDVMGNVKKTYPEASDMYKDLERNSIDFADVGKPNGMYQYQKDDVQKFLDLFDEGKRVILDFNKMGLGKTPEAIATAMESGAIRILVLCNKNTALNWKKEIYKWTGENSALTFPDTYNKFEDWKAKMLHRWFITNVETLRNTSWAEFVLNWGFDFVIYDEAHSMRNVEDAAKARQAFFFLNEWLTRSATYDPVGKLMNLSGSPIVNSAGDLYPHLALAYPDTYRRRSDFVIKECLATTGYKGKEKISGFINPKRINAMINAIGVQHTKEEKLPGLPAKTYNVIALEMEEKQREIYDNIVEDIGVMLDDGNELFAPEILEKFIRMRQVCVDPELIGVTDANSAKLDYLKDNFLDEIGDEPFVIFSTFETILADKIKDMMKEKEKKVGFITGKVSSDTRMENIEKFQRGELDVMFATIQAGSEGVTLTRASHVVMLDRWWTPASNEQAVDRLHRISQVNAVTVHWLQIQDAFDVYLDRVLEQKGRVAESARTGEIQVADTRSMQQEVAKLMFGKRIKD